MAAVAMTAAAASVVASSASTTTSATAPATTATRATIPIAIMAAILFSAGRDALGSIVPVKVRLVRFLFEIAPAFDGHRGCGCGLGRSLAAAHLRPLLFQNCLARQANTIAFDRQHFHENLIAFFQFVADVFDPVFRNLADVQQSVGARNDFDKRTKVGEA